MDHPRFTRRVPTFLSANARALLASRGAHSMDRMSRDETRAFQLAYFKCKSDLEDGRDQYLFD